MNALRIALAALAALIALDWSAHAASGEPLTFHFTGEVRFIDQAIDLDDSVYVGAPFSGGYTFDPTGVTDSSPNPNVGNYFFSTGQLWADIGNYEFVTPDLIMFIVNDSFSGDIYEAISVTPFTAAGIQWTIMDILLGDQSQTALDSDTLPLDVPDLPDFPSYRGFELFLPGDEPGIVGSLTSITPEPSSLTLLGLGSSVLLTLRRRCRG